MIKVKGGPKGTPEEKKTLFFKKKNKKQDFVTSQKWWNLKGVWAKVKSGPVGFKTPMK